MFFADTCPVTMRHSICTVSERHLPGLAHARSPTAASGSDMAHRDHPGGPRSVPFGERDAETRRRLCPAPRPAAPCTAMRTRSARARDLDCDISDPAEALHRTTKFELLPIGCAVRPPASDRPARSPARAPALPAGGADAPAYRRSRWPDRSPSPAAACPARSRHAYPRDAQIVSAMLGAGRGAPRSGTSPLSETWRSRSICSSLGVLDRRARRPARSHRRARSPAAAAGPSSRTCPTTGLTTSVPTIARIAYSSEAKMQIHGRPGQQHRDAMPDRAAREGAVQFRGRHLALALIEQLHVSAQRNGGEAILGAVGVAADPHQQRFSKTDAEAQHLEAELLRRPSNARTREPRPIFRSQPERRRRKYHASSCEGSIARGSIIAQRQASRLRHRHPTHPPSAHRDATRGAATLCQ